jgi:hypothetical protein
MSKIKSLELPEQLPILGALQSWGQNKHDYLPEFWEVKYEKYRYLKNVTDYELDKRYQDLFRNFYILVRPERHIIPVNSFLSSWYWYRKEHQTRYEFFLRNRTCSLPLPFPRGNYTAPVRPKGPNACNILFRYGDSRFMVPFFKSGEIRISLASIYKDGPVLDPRTDDELNIHRHLPGQYTSIKTKNGKEIPFIGDVHEIYSIPMNFYTLCMSTDFEPKMFEEFGYDSCLIINDPDQFTERLETSTKNLMSNSYFHHNPVEYFDPYEPYNNQYLAPEMCKDFSFAYQMEYRFIWVPYDNTLKKEYIFIRIGSLEDICELYVR